MVKVESKARRLSWKPVEIDGSLFTDGGCEGLVGIEELTDYELTEENEVIDSRSNTKLKKVKKGKIDKKKKVKDKTKNVVKGPNTFTVTSINLNKINEEMEDVETLCDSTVTSKTIPEESYYPWTNIYVPKVIAKSLLEEGFTEPTEIQANCIPPALKGRKDMLGAAETGSGKTLAFGIPILYGIMKQKEKEQNQGDEQMEEEKEDEEEEEAVNDDGGLGCVKVVDLGPANRSDPSGRIQSSPLALVLTPTRELAMQINKHLLVAARFTGIKVAVLVGGMSVEKQKRLLRRMPEVIVATPGRLWDLVTNGEVAVNNVRFLAIDEADRMTEVNHFPELRSLLELLNSDPVGCKQRQNFIFSATLTLVHDLPKHVKKKLEKKKKKNRKKEEGKLSKLVELVGVQPASAKVVDLTRREAVAQTLTETRVICASDMDKDVQLYLFLKQHPRRTLVFCNSIGCVKRLAALLTVLDCRPLPLHASMPQRQRLKNLDRFKEREDGILLATDVAARGLDIADVAQVAHFQVPRTAEAYVHRSGRTARAKRQGLTVIFMQADEVDTYRRLCATLGRAEKDIDELEVDRELLAAVRERVRVARDVERLEGRMRRESTNRGWLERAARELELILDDEEERGGAVGHAPDRALQQALADKRRRLSQLLKAPIRPKVSSLRYPLLEKDIDELEVDRELLAAVRERVRVARDVERLEGRMRRESTNRGWLERAARELELILDDEEERGGAVGHAPDRALQQALADKRRRLSQLLKAPIRPKVSSLRYPLLG